MRWLTNFYDFRFDWTAPAAIGIQPYCHSWWISKMQSGHEDILEEWYAIKLYFKLGKNATEMYGRLQTAFGASCMKEHQFLSGIRDSRKAQSLWGMMRGVGGVRKSIHQSWLAKRLGLGLLCWGFKWIRKKPALFKSGQWHFQQDNAPVHNYILVTEYLTKMGIKTVPQTPCSHDLAPCDFCLFPKFRGYRYETMAEMKEAVTKFIDTLTQEDFHGAF